MAGQLTENAVLGFMDYCAAYISVLLGRCVLISVLFFVLILLMRRVLFRKSIFLKGMLWGVLLTAPFLGKLRVIHEMDSFGSLFAWWDMLCQERVLVRLGYILGIVLSACMVYYRHRRLSRMIRCMEKEEIRGQQVYMNELPVTPFTTGLLHPKIIIPRIIKESFHAEELRMILLHESIHIHAGHLWFYMIWDIVQIVLWPNPLFIVCRTLFQEDLEDICDRITIQKSGEEAGKYGKVLLKSMRVLDFGKAKEPVTFVGNRGYRSVRQRFLRIAEFEPYRDFRVRMLCTAGAVVLAGILMLTIQNSYPRYMELQDVVLADASGEVLAVLQDSRQLRKAVSRDGHKVYINRESMDQILQEQGIELKEEQFVLGIGGYTKIPSMGGGGSIADVDYSGQEPEISISYYNGDNRLPAKIFKWML